MYQPKKNTLCCLFPLQQQKAVLRVLPIIYSLYAHRSVSHMPPAGNCFVLEDTETPAAGGVFPVNLQSHVKEVNEQLCLTSGQVANLACENELSERRLQITSRMPLPPSKISSGWGSLLERTCLYQSLHSSLRTHRVKTAILGLGTSAVSRALAAERSAQLAAPAETVQTPCQPLSEGDNHAASRKRVWQQLDRHRLARSCRLPRGLGEACGSGSCRQEPAKLVTTAKHKCRHRLHCILLSGLAAAPNWLQQMP